MSVGNITGSTLTQTTALSSKFVGNTGQFDALNVNGIIVNKVTNYPEEDRNALFTAFGANLLKQELDVKINNIAEDVSGVYFSPVLSDSIVNTHFVDKDIVLENCILDLQECISINNAYTEVDDTTLISSVTVTNEAFNLLGKYFIEFTVKSIPSGKIEITNEKGKVLKTISIAGTYLFETITTQDTLPSLTISLYGVKYKDIVRYTYLGIYHVKSAFESYFTYMVAKIQSEGNDYATVEDLADAISIVKNELRNYTNEQVALVLDRLTVHENDKGNPHEVTPAKIQAANAIHKHTLSDITDYNADVLKPVEELQTTVNALSDTLDIHLQNKNNPHEVTPVGINAADRVHIHASDEVLITTNEGSETLTSKLSTVDNKMLTTNADLVRHTQSKGNVHELTFTQLDPPYATQSEAIDGTLTNKIMSPLRTKEVMNILLNGTENVDITRLTTQYISKLELSNAVNHISFPISTEYTYHLCITDIANQLNPRNIGIYFDDGSGNTNIDKTISTFTYIKDDSVINLVDTGNIHYLSPNDNEITAISGTILCNLVNMHLSSTLVGKVFKELEQLTSFTPISLSSVNVDSLDLTKINTCHLYLIDTNINTKLNLTVNRLVTPTDPSLIVDALPVGSIVYKYTSSYKDGYLIQDGSEVSRDNYAELYAEAVDSGNIITKDAWNNIKANVGDTTAIPHFHYGDGTTTFGLPYIPKNSFNQYSFIKAKSVVVPNGPTNLVYDYIWTDETTTNP